MAYPPVEITNNTEYKCKGTVKFAGCSSDNYSVDPGKKSTGPGRGLCLLTRISATVDPGGQDISATSYTSSGTSYSKFAIIKDGNNYVVTRIVSAVEPETEDQDAVDKTLRGAVA